MCYMLEYVMALDCTDQTKKETLISKLHVSDAKTKILLHL